MPENRFSYYHHPSASTGAGLADALRDGDSDAWSQVFKVWYPRLVGMFCAVGVKLHDAQDLAQIVFVKASSAIERDKFKRNGTSHRLCKFISKIASNEIANFFNAKNKQPNVIGGSNFNTMIANLAFSVSISDSDQPRPATSPLSIAKIFTELRKSTSEIVWKSIEMKINSPNLTFREIGEELGIEGNAARQNYDRTKKRIAKLLAEQNKPSHE